MKIYDKKLAYPYFVWMVLFTVVPLFIVVYYALTDSAGSFTLDNLVTVSGYGSVFARSLLLAIISTVVCLIIAFPVGYFLSRLRVNKQHIMLMLVMLPMWMNFLLRTYAWMGLLSLNGPVNAVLGVFGLGPYNMLNTSGAVQLCAVYDPAPLHQHDQNRPEHRGGSAGPGRFHHQDSVPGAHPHEHPRHQHRHHDGVRPGGVHLRYQPYAGMQFLGNSYNLNVGSAMSLVLMVIVLLCMSFTSSFDEDEMEGVS